MTYADIEKLPEYLQYLYMISNTSQSYEFFVKIAMALRRCGGKSSELIEWWALYEKELAIKYYEKKDKKAIDFFEKSFIVEDFEKKFNSGKKGESNSYGLPTLKNYAELANPEYFIPRWKGQLLDDLLNDAKSESDILLKKYFNPNFEHIKIIVEYCPFVSQIGTEHEKNIFTPEKVIILQAYLGKGKTTAIQRLLPRYKRILFLSPRIAFSKFLCKDFGAICYLDVDFGAICNLDADGRTTLDKLVMSMEGLHKLKSALDYDCIIFDECEDNLGVFASSTMKSRNF
jgi:hypothetical protein